MLVEHFFFKTRDWGKAVFYWVYFLFSKLCNRDTLWEGFLKWNLGDPETPPVEGSWDAALCANQVIIPNSARRGFRPGE